MPFTFAHPAVVVFNKNKYLNLSALILGSMAPDFIYFILFSPSSNVGHTLFGFILLNLPLCFVLNFLFHRYIKYSIILSLPNKIANKYTYLFENNNSISNLKDFIIFCYSALIGMFTHVFWDAFTHETGFFVSNIKLLREYVSLLGHDVAAYKILQHGSTVLGTLIILIYVYKIRNNKGFAIRLNISTKFKIYLTLILTEFFVLISSFYCFKPMFGIGRFVVTTINGLFLGSLICGVNLSTLISNKKNL